MPGTHIVGYRSAVVELRHRDWGLLGLWLAFMLFVAAMLEIAGGL
ncbi:MAG TPA: hypothetical protein VFB34_02870 [Chloroflexota bacterium]|nr:hypothetical protein [Chloroflexota bacterium]